MPEGGIALNAIMHMVAALHRQGYVVSERPKDIVGPGTECHHCLSSLDRACLRSHAPARGFGGQAARIALAEASAPAGEEIGISLCQHPGIGRGRRAAE